MNFNFNFNFNFYLILFIFSFLGNPFADVGGGGGGGGGGMGGGAGGANPFDELCDPANVRGPVNSNAMMVEVGVFLSLFF